MSTKQATLFLAASDYVSPSRADEEHLTARGHEVLAAAVQEKLRESVLLLPGLSG